MEKLPKFLDKTKYILNRSEHAVIHLFIFFILLFAFSCTQGFAGAYPNWHRVKAGNTMDQLAVHHRATWKEFPPESTLIQTPDTERPKAEGSNHNLLALLQYCYPLQHLLYMCSCAQNRLQFYIFTGVFWTVFIQMLGLYFALLSWIHILSIYH